MVTVSQVKNRGALQVLSEEEVELLVPKKGRRGGAKRASKKKVPVPAPMRVEPERQEPKKGKPNSGRWDGYLCLVEASDLVNDQRVPIVAETK
ncbi:UNVERIFIED_CONTAM: hypothetical protein FKN15_073662 [Acipenser sinensis]